MQRNNALLTEIRENLPKEAFRPQPIMGLLAFGVVASIIFLSWYVFRFNPPWYAALLLSLILGQLYSTLVFLAHETCHGAVFRSRLAQDVLGYFGFLIFCFSPTLWRVWHNQLHHGNTNIDTIEPLDPDAVKHIEIFNRNKNRPWVWRFIRIYPGSYHWSSKLYPFFGLSLEAVVVLWILSQDHPDYYKNLNRSRALLEHLLIIFFWIALSILLGLKAALFVILLPMIFANLTVIAYILTNHTLRPLVQEDNPLKHSMSITTYPVLDWIHLRFSHHVEHHFFPAMSFRYTPLIRKLLKEKHSDDYLAPPLLKALRWVYRRPTFYHDSHSFINPDQEKPITVQEIEAALRSG